jgi:hypothetical protein
MVGEPLRDGLLEVWAKVKALARRRRREEWRLIGSSFWSQVQCFSVHQDFTPAMREVQWTG